jgi:hypothetical protein
MTRRVVVAVFVATELWQVVFGAFTSLQLGAPGVGDRASWVPGALVAETYTVLPVGFLLCLWGVPWARWLAALCAGASLALAVVAVITLSSVESSFVFGLLLLAPPGLALLMCVLRMRRSGRLTQP